MAEARVSDISVMLSDVDSMNNRTTQATMDVPEALFFKATHECFVENSDRKPENDLVQLSSSQIVITNASVLSTGRMGIPEGSFSTATNECLVKLSDLEPQHDSSSQVLIADAPDLSTGLGEMKATPSTGFMSLANTSELPVSDDDFTAAGVLPYCTAYGEVLFLLGEEYLWTRRPKDGKIVGGYFWKDFGGQREESDRSVEETAAREFSEETLGMFPDVRVAATCTGVDRSTEDMKAKLESGGPGIYKVRNGQYVMFLAPVEYIDGFSFAMAREANNSRMEIAAAEKRDFAWISARELLAKLKGHASYIVLTSERHRRVHMFRKFVLTMRNFDQWEHLLLSAAGGVGSSLGTARRDRPGLWLGLDRNHLRKLGVFPYTPVVKHRPPQLGLTFPADSCGSILAGTSNQGCGSSTLANHNATPQEPPDGDGGSGPLELSPGELQSSSEVVPASSVKPPGSCKRPWAALESSLAQDPAGEVGQVPIALQSAAVPAC